jgi:hypothetical protein
LVCKRPRNNLPKAKGLFSGIIWNSFDLIQNEKYNKVFMILNKLFVGIFVLKSLQAVYKYEDF